MKHNRFLIGVTFFTSILLLAGFLVAGSTSEKANTKGLTLSAVKADKMAVSVGTLSEETQSQSLADDKNASPSLALSPMQGGEDIASATVIPTLPYLDSGTTAGYADDYQEECESEGLLNFPDVVYSYTPQRYELVNIMTCESSYFTRLFVYRTNADTLVACNRFAIECGQPPRGGLSEVPMDSGRTYYIVIDGDDLAGALPPGYGDYVIECTREPILADSLQVHPAFADNGSSGLILAYEDIIGFDDGSADSLIMWLGSADDMATIAAVGAWSIHASYPSIKAWGSSGQFYGTLVPSAGEFSGGRTYLVDINNPGIVDGWSLASWDWAQHGWHDMKMSAIVADDQMASWQWGMLSFVSSTTWGDGLIDAPHISFPIDDQSATISWLVGVDGCNTTDITIDKVTRWSFAVYDWLNPESNTWELLIRQDFVDSLLEDPGPGTNAWSFTAGDTLEHTLYPSVAAHDGNLVIISEYWDENLGDDHDIICWYTSDSDIVSLNLSIVAATADNERYPKVSHVGGGSFVCTYVNGDTLFQSISNDAGATWSTPEAISDPGAENVVGDYRSADHTEEASKMAWEFRIKDSPDSSIFVRIANTSIIIDSDGDGVPDDADICPGYDDNVDSDSDGVPDGCDLCPGHDDSIDSDGDGIPDGCDWACGDANGDTSVNVGDGVYLLNYIFRFGAPPVPLESAEVNCDGTVNIGDAVYILNYVFRDGPAPCSECD